MDFATIAHAFADIAVTALWQSAAVAMALSLCLRLAPRTSASDRFRVWGVGFAAVAMLPFLPIAAGFIHQFFGSTTSAAAGSLVGSAPDHPWLELSSRWSFAIALLWGAASLARSVDLIVHSFRLRRLWKRAVPVTVRRGVDVQFGAGRETRTTAGLETGATGFEVCATQDLDKPSVIGFLRPRILIPEWLLDRLTPAELSQVVLHEAEHLRRHDDWLNLLQKLCIVLFPLNPALLWMEGRLCCEREMACDEGVVRRTRAPREYAACLTSLAQRGLEHRADVALSLGAWQRRSELVQRVHRILRNRSGLSPAAARALLGTVACGLVFGAVEFARCPQLVEFATTPSAQASAVPEIAPSATAMADFRAVNAVAHVPTRTELAEMRAEARPRATEKAGGAQKRTTAGPSTRSLRELAQDNKRLETQDPAPQQLIVFTAWEQIETTPAATAASLSNGASEQVAEQATAGGNNQIPTAAHATGMADVSLTATAPQVTRQYTVTRLILRIYPASGAKAGTGAKSSPQSGPQSGPPAAVPLRDGWLVFQL